MPKLKPNTGPAYLPLSSSPLVQSAREKRREEIRANIRSLIKLSALALVAVVLLLRR